jgi:ribose transport system substrate-binding protein
MNMSFYIGLKQGLEEAAAANGACLIVTNSDLDPAQQLTDAQNLLAQGVDYLAVTAVDGKAMLPIVGEAKAAGIPLLAICDLIPSDDVDMNIGMGHTESGELEAAELAAFLEAKYGEVKGKVVDLQGTPGTDTTLQRAAGLEELVAKYPGIEVVSTVSGEWAQETANSVMTDVLQAHPDIDALYSAQDDMAVGAIRAIETAGLLAPVGDPKHIWVGGINGDPTGIDKVRQGFQDASVSSNPFGMATYAFEQIKELRDNGTPLTKDFEFPPYAITPANIDSPETAEYGIWADLVDANK